MRTKLVAAIIAVLVFFSIGQAQGYYITTDYRTNLRVSGSLDSRVVETVAVGTTLHVVGSADRWLQISRNGSQLWMAEWVSHNRVDAAPADVDNCCYVNRQCNSQQEWVDGYWAYQRNECPVGASSAPSTSAQPVSTTPSAIDNCCFVDRQCTTDADWTDGYFAFQNGHCSVLSGAQQGALLSITESINVWTPHMTEGVKRFLANPTTDPFNNCCFMHHDRVCQSDEDWQRGAVQYQNHECTHPAPLWRLPTIVDHGTPVGSARFTDLVNTALELIRVHAPEWLKYIQVSGIREIQLIPGFGTAGFYNRSWMVGLGYWSERHNDPNWVPGFNHILAYVTGITHEACHAIKQRTYTQTDGRANEAPCNEAGLAANRAVRSGSR